MTKEEMDESRIAELEQQVKALEAQPYKPAPSSGLRPYVLVATDGFSVQSLAIPPFRR